MGYFIVAKWHHMAAEIWISCGSANGSNHLKQCWPIWNFPGSNLTVNVESAVFYNEFEKYTLQIIATRPGTNHFNILLRTPAQKFNSKHSSAHVPIRTQQTHVAYHTIVSDILTNNNIQLNFLYFSEAFG